MKQILLYNHSGCENKGCEAIVRSTASLLQEAQIVLASNSPEVDRKAGIREVFRIISPTISPLSPLRLINSVGYRLGQRRETEVTRRYSPVIQEGNRSDLCLSIGGDTYCYGWQEHMHYINRHIRTPKVLWSCSIDPDRLDNRMMEDLSAYERIYARESLTYEAMRDKRLPVFLSRDPAFRLEMQSVQMPERWVKNGTIGINLSPLALFCAENSQVVLNAFIYVIEMLLRETGHSIALIPHVTWSHDDDREALGRLQESFAGNERVFMVPSGWTAGQYKTLVSGLRMLITARTHLSIAGYSTGVPTLVIGYSVKARGIARDLFGQEDGHLLQVQQMQSEKELASAVSQLMLREDRERAHLQQVLPEYLKPLDAAVRQMLS